MIKCASCRWDKPDEDIRNLLCSECRLTRDRLIRHHIRDIENGIELGTPLASTDFAVWLQIEAWKLELEYFKSKLSDA